MFKRLKAALAAGLLFFAATPALAEPAIWVIKDPDSTIYLFGTVHVLKRETQWRTPRLEAALASADEVWLELSDSDDTANMQALVARLGMDP
ncbi:MAG: TraB/GumN family protein, partial [Caulobacteraceae bacterium]|nr:TraB/GumN family protein [Caulobacteraceae bacterium]